MAKVDLDKDRFRALFEENYCLLCNYVNALTHDWDLSQEIAQRSFVKIWERRQEISLEGSGKSYLFQTARNTLVDHFRSARVLDIHIQQYANRVEELVDPPVLEERSVEIKCKLAWAVNQLKPKTREIFLLNKQEGLTYDEIADYLQVARRTVEYNMKVAMEQLKEILKGKIELT